MCIIHYTRSLLSVFKQKQPQYNNNNIPTVQRNAFHICRCYYYCVYLFFLSFTFFLKFRNKHTCCIRVKYVLVVDAVVLALNEGPSLKGTLSFVPKSHLNFTQFQLNLRPIKIISHWGSVSHYFGNERLIRLRS